MPVPEIIRNDFRIIPLAFEHQVQTHFQNKRSMIYYFVNGSENETPILYLKNSPNLRNAGELPMTSHEEIIYDEGQFIYNDQRYPTFDALLASDTNLARPILKQDIIAAFLNKFNFKFRDQFFLTKDWLYSPGKNWQVDFPTTWTMLDERRPLPARAADYQVLLEKNSVAMFFPAKKNFEEYRKRLSGLLGFEVIVTDVKDTFIGGEANSTLFYWQLSQDCYANFLKKINEAPSLQDLCFRELALVKNPSRFFSVNKLPQNLIDDSRFVYGK